MHLPLLNIHKYAQNWRLLANWLYWFICKVKGETSVEERLKCHKLLGHACNCTVEGRAEKWKVNGNLMYGRYRN